MSDAAQALIEDNRGCLRCDGELREMAGTELDDYLDGTRADTHD